jgi:hypothetical protein
MPLNVAWEMLRQRTTCRFACSTSQLSCRGCRTCFLRLLLLLRTACFQIFQLQFQLFNLPLDLLRFAAELQPLQTRDHQSQAFDLRTMRGDLLLQAPQFFLTRGDLCVLLHHHLP